MTEQKPKSAEYRYKLTISRARKINLGNYESQDLFESLSQGFDDESELPEIRQKLTSEVQGSIDGQILLLAGNFQNAADMSKPALTKVSQYTGGKIEECGSSTGGVPDEALWPKVLECRECGQLVDRRESKYPGNPYYYKCGCGIMNYSKGYVPKNGGK